VLARNAGRCSGAPARGTPTIATGGGGRQRAWPPLIHAVLPRRTLLVRRQADSEREAQLIAANVDVVFLVSALDAPVNLRRLERMLAVTHSSGATPVIVLSKADLAEDVEEVRAEVEQIASGRTWCSSPRRTRPASRRCASGCAPASPACSSASGVGKSTLVNRLVGDERLATTEVRAADRKGRHTTTHRELIVLSEEAAHRRPGIRELGCGRGRRRGPGVRRRARAGGALPLLQLPARGGAGCAVHAAVEEGRSGGALLGT